MSGATLVPLHVISYFVYGAFTLFGCTVRYYSTILDFRFIVVLNPILSYGLGSFLFARRYLGNRFFFLFLRLLRCFSSPGILLCDYFIHHMVHEHYLMWVPPFGNLRVNGCLRLSAAFRSLPRPSSAPVAKASALCSFLLNLFKSFLSLRNYCIFSEFPASWLSFPSLLLVFFLLLKL